MWSDSGSAFSLVCSLISQVSVTCEANVSFKDKMLTACFDSISQGLLSFSPLTLSKY